MRANEIIEVLDKFRESTYYQKILINGDWGIGKTKYILDFKNDNEDVCYISLFGKKDIEIVIQEIYSYLIGNARLKKSSNFIRNALKEVNVGIAGVSISVPLIGDLHSTLNKKLKEKNQFIIIFDDFERRHPDLKIVEILGLIDALSKLENIKSVLVAAKDKIVEEAEIFINYQEKAIDRVYNITTFSENAPLEILGNEIWGVLKNYVESFKFNNLRTFEKTALFIREVVDELGQEVFTERFTKNDIYRMCFATILFKVEHKSDMRLLPTDNSISEFKKSLYDSGGTGVVSYIDDYIFRNSLDNMMSKNVLTHILTWYDTGVFSEDIIFVIDSINNFKEELGNFFSSEQDIVKTIRQTQGYLENLSGKERIEDVISKLSIAFSWCDVLEIDFGWNDDSILKIIKKNIVNKINLDRSFFENEISLSLMHIESERGKRLASAVNTSLKEEFQKLFIQKVMKLLKSKNYEVIVLRNFSDFVNTVRDQKTQENILRTLNDNQYFFPLPIGEITQNQWFWCHQINRIVKDIESFWGKENYYNDFKKYIFELEEVKLDKLLKYRLTTIIESS